MEKRQMTEAEEWLVNAVATVLGIALYAAFWTSAIVACAKLAQ